MSVAASGKPAARKRLFGWIGKVWGGIWLICGIAVLAYVTSSVTSVMTTLSLNNQIHGVDDLSGHRIGVRTGSVAEQYAHHNGLDARSYAHIDDAVRARTAGEIEAIVGDAPVLEYYAHENPSQRVAAVGPIFEPDKYGFGLPLNSTLTRPLTVELIGAHEDDVIENIKARYFGDSQ